MNKDYEYYMNMSDKCMTKANEYRIKHEIDLAIFYHNASNDFKNKALNMMMED